MTEASSILDGKFFLLFSLCIIASMLTGSTLQWIVKNGWFETRYNILVTAAAISSLIQTVTCFINFLMAPDHNLAFMIYILVNWVIMTHTSVMLVSNRLALTTLNPKQTWERLLLINLFMFPISVFVCIYWSTAHNFDSEAFKMINSIMEPIQIGLWGIIEFCLSGAFILKMWQFQWTDVERQGIFVLVLVAMCDTLSVLLNLLVGDLESTSIKGFVYCLRIRLEVNVLCTMVDFVKSKNNRPTSSNTQEDVNAESEEIKRPARRHFMSSAWGMMTLTSQGGGNRDEGKGSDYEVSISHEENSLGQEKLHSESDDRPNSWFQQKASSKRRGKTHSDHTRDTVGIENSDDSNEGEDSTKKISGGRSGSFFQDTETGSPQKRSSSFSSQTNLSILANNTPAMKSSFSGDIVPVEESEDFC